MHDLLLVAVIVLANGLGMVMVVPQAARVLRTGVVAGVSPVWAGTGVAFNSWWLAYGLGAPRPAIVPVSLASVAAYLALSYGLVRHQHLAGRALGAALATATVVPAAVFAGAGWTAVGVFLGLAYGAQLFPAVVSAWRSADTSGISRTTWVMAGSEAVAWGIVGLARTDAALLVAALSGTVMASLVLMATVRPPTGRGRLSWRPA